MSKNLNVGIGFSKNDNAFEAGKAAAKQAVKGLGGKKPTISYVFFAGDYDPKKLSDGLMSVLKGSEFVGGSADAVFYETNVIRKGIVVASIQSEYLHVGVASIDNVSKDPYKAAQKTVIEALSKLSIDKYIDPYLQFMRMRKSSIKWMVKTPSFFLTVFTRGMKLPKMGDETKIVRGIVEEIGANVPIWGGSLGVPLEKLFTGKPYEIYALHSGKIMKDGIIIVVNTCSLLYGLSLIHGCERTDKLGFISKISGDGYVVEKISGKNSVDWYSENLGVSKKKFIKNSLILTQKRPLGVPDNYGGFIVRSGGVPAGKNLAFTAPFVEGWPVYIMNASQKNLLHAADKIKKDISGYTKESKSSIVFAGLCASRRIVLEKKLNIELRNLKKSFGDAHVFGFSCFAEIGSRRGVPSGIQHLAANVFTLYDKLLHEVKN